jgi:hypothetical protein
MTVVALRCDDQIARIDQLLKTVSSDPRANTRAAHQLMAELKSAQKVLRKIKAGIESNEDLTIDFNNIPNPDHLGWWDRATWREKLSGKQANDIVSLNIVLKGDPIKLDEVIMHELSHKYGVKRDWVGGSWTNDAHVFDDLMTASMDETDWFTYRWKQMHLNPGDPAPVPPTPK